jgi:hypothetical protein
MKIIAPTLALAFAAVAACAPVSSESPTVATASSDSRQCLHVPSVNGFKAVDHDTVNVSTGVSTVYQLDLLGDCRDIDWNTRIALRSRGGSAFACDALDLEVISPTTLAPDVCPVVSMRKLSDTEVAALPRDQRP